MTKQFNTQLVDISKLVLVSVIYLMDQHTNGFMALSHWPAAKSIHPCVNSNWYCKASLKRNKYSLFWT